MKPINSSELYIKYIDLRRICGNKKVIIYGIGKFGKRLIEENSSLNIVSIIDRDYQGKDYKLIPVYRLSEIEMEDEGIILICTKNHYVEVLKDLSKKNVSDRYELYVVDFDYNIDTYRMIHHNNSVWNKKIDSEGREVLIPIYCWCVEHTIIDSYYANYLSSKYMADIKGFISFEDTKEFDIPIMPSYFDVLKSFGMKEIIDTKLPSNLLHEKEIIFQDVIKKIGTIEDWSNIIIQGESWGEAIVRNYLRYYELSFDPRGEDFFICLDHAIKSILFWDYYFSNHEVKCIITCDGTVREGYMRDVASKYNIPVYAINLDLSRKVFYKFRGGYEYKYFKKFFDMMTDDEKETGICWGRRQLNLFINGSKNAITPYRGSNTTNVFSHENEDFIPINQNNIGIMICPHIFDEDSMEFEWQLFDNYLLWLETLGKLSEITHYSWYLKMHPDEHRRGKKLYEEFLNTFKKITPIPARTSPIKLKKAGIDYALTVGGSIGHEYPIIGINVINAASNPHIAFGFNMNPETREEYINAILNLKEKCKINTNEVYQYYCIAYHYYNNQVLTRNKELFMYDLWYDGALDHEVSISYKRFLQNFSADIHYRILSGMQELFESMDNYRPNYFYRNNSDKVYLEKE